MDVPEIDPLTLPDDAVMIDVREQHEWDAGHAPGAVHIPLADLPARLEDLPTTDNGTIPVTCRSGGRSGRAVAWLVQQGFDVANMRGGMKAWQAAGKELKAKSDAPATIV